ncbi:MAG: DEAD/DEAH box helicase [Candidatus Phytoplasma stylosanthis]|uniref:DEAD/DEAH box helicase n=1 Tax=Candidatus Phytoplasma stylosanthis TaxID=2798314 RepID=UPI00293B19D3|nr:DEAD/DEAH box helicase [Candidatus Phytoplasma stylosanthis]MDV3168110.1 DEAD/DEAH box helicase [Candidatus Phytoplasma stylosanthis]MDV3170985.1 DEAD/DEAH box helicase [Candidatus Phytoplasma stylosanthis]MDV3173790.1 DEAD/DEAH box helicase [Candidatus Phytoplasma stylosanthis]MDV3174301.1 DEAD/DEAH box helicase [Candidatus Phytoplasma stylosanthis]MDV3202484.1 DEAD/DEAH box helicase [Candidatus Phytoplasma stylosanthis]
MSILFKDLNLLKQTEDVLERLNFANPTPIQALVIPEIINGHDVIAQSQTGTGKTFSFGIPIIEKIDPQLPKIQSLILCPTRELALQVFLEIKKLLRFNRLIRVIVVYGGESYIRQFKDLENKPHIVIATPGRMIDLLNKKKIDLSNVKILTLDEADEMLKMGFKEDLETILSHVPLEQRQTVLFSATMPNTIKEIASKYQKEPKIIKVAQDTIAVKAIKQFYFIVKEFDKNKLLVRLLDQKNPDSVIIFANTKKDVDNIFNYLQERDFLVDAIHGDLKQNQRKIVMNSFRQKNIKILVATDVAARGIDISDITMIINYDLPHEDEVYIHRIGRTGRAGKEGVAYSFISSKKIFQLKKLERYLKDQIIYLKIPTIEEVKNGQKEFFKNKIFNLIQENKEEKKELHPLVDILLEKKDSKEIISSFLNYFSPRNKNYEYIAESFIKSSNYNKFNNYSNNKLNYNQNNRFSKKPMKELVINLGKDDGINPSLLLKLLKEKFNIYSQNVGNIKHFYDKTVFEINLNFVNRIKNNNNVYYEKKLLQIQSK